MYVVDTFPISNFLMVSQLCQDNSTRMPQSSFCVHLLFPREKKKQRRFNFPPYCRFGYFSVRQVALVRLALIDFNQNIE